MPRTSYRATRRTGSSTYPRRRRSWARQHLGDLTVAAGTQSNSDALSDFKTTLGVSEVPPGMTIGGGWISWAFRADAAPTGIEPIRVGLIVVDEMSAAQVPSLSTEAHADWMHYDVCYIDQGGQGVIVDSTSSYWGRRWRASRRMDEIQMRLYFALLSPVAGTAEVNISTVLVNP